MSDFLKRLVSDGTGEPSTIRTIAVSVTAVVLGVVILFGVRIAFGKVTDIPPEFGKTLAMVFGAAVVTKVAQTFKEF